MDFYESLVSKSAMLRGQYYRRIYWNSKLCAVHSEGFLLISLLSCEWKSDEGNSYITYKVMQVFYKEAIFSCKILYYFYHDYRVLHSSDLLNYNL